MPEYEVPVNISTGVINAIAAVDAAIDATVGVARGLEDLPYEIRLHLINEYLGEATTEAALRLALARLILQKAMSND